MGSAKGSFKIRNVSGLHARPAAKLVEIASLFSAEFWIGHKGQRVNGKSILGVMTLGATLGETLELEATGEDAECMIHVLGRLIERRFFDPK